MENIAFCATFAPAISMRLPLVKNNAQSENVSCPIITHILSCFGERRPSVRLQRHIAIKLENDRTDESHVLQQLSALPSERFHRIA